MKKQFENIIKAISSLSDNNQKFIITQLKEINNHINYLINKNDSFKSQLTGINPKLFNDDLQKAIEVLKLYGFDEYRFNALSPDFLNWFIENTIRLKNYNPRLMNYYLLNSMQIAYFMCKAEKENPTYQEVKQTLLHVDDLIAQFEKESNRDFNQLIKDIHGTN